MKLALSYTHWRTNKRANVLLPQMLDRLEDLARFRESDADKLARVEINLCFTAATALHEWTQSWKSAFGFVRQCTRIGG